MAEDFERVEHRKFGQDGFHVFGIYDLSQYTPV
jgi:hypothetical protein